LRFLGLFLAALSAAPANGQSPSAGPGGYEFVEGEDIIYNVRYAFLDLGQIRIKTRPATMVDGAPCHSTVAYINSYRGIPFVDLHAVFESMIDGQMFSRWFMGKIKQDDVWDFSRYAFQYDRKRVIVEMGRQDTMISERDTVVLESSYQDGLSLFFLARDGLFSGKRVNVPTMIKEKKVNTVINFRNERTSVEIDAVEYPIDVVEFDGTMEFIGIFGLTGDFEGWFSNDAARVPIMAKMKVLIGSVTIELMQWKRGSWSPPRALE
jgi:hypothetical protein